MKTKKELLKKLSYNRNVFLGVLFFIIGILFVLLLYLNAKNRFATVADLKSVRRQDVYAKIEANVMTDYFVTHDYAGIEHKTYFIWDSENVYLVDLNDKTRKQLDEIYTYSYSEAKMEAPSSVTIKGMTKLIPKDLQEEATRALNKILEQEVVNENNFKEIFGVVYLDTFESPLTPLLGNFLLALTILFLGIIFLFLFFINKKRTL